MGSASQSQSNQTSTNVDKRLVTESGEIFALQDSTVNVEGGGTLQVINRDPGAAIAAIDAIERQGAQIAATAATLTRGSNEIAAQVADSQKAFVEVASGQRSVTLAVAIVAGLAALVVLPQVIRSR